jgi:hypothetical protein
MIQDYYTTIKSSDDFVVLAHLLLQDETEKDMHIVKRFSSESSKGIATFLPSEKLDLDLIYSKSQIKTLCSRNHFMLRHSADTRVQLKSAVIGQIKELENRFSIIIKSYYVLTNHEDDSVYSMLFCKLPNGCFYRIDEDEIEVKRLKAIVLKSNVNLISSMLLPALLAVFICSFTHWSYQLMCGTAVLLLMIGVVFYK